MKFASESKYQQLRHDFTGDFQPNGEYQASVWVTTESVTKQPGHTTEFLVGTRVVEPGSLPQNRPFSARFGSRPQLRLPIMENELGAGVARKDIGTANPIGIREELP